MKAISKPEIDTILTDVKKALRQGVYTIYDLMQTMGNAINACIEWVNTNGETLADNEDERISNEETRVTAEQGRDLAEQGRIDSENNRVQSETDREEEFESMRNLISEWSSTFSQWKNTFSQWKNTFSGWVTDFAKWTTTFAGWETKMSSIPKMQKVELLAVSSTVEVNVTVDSYIRVSCVDTDTQDIDELTITNGTVRYQGDPRGEMQLCLFKATSSTIVLTGDFDITSSGNCELLVEEI